MSGIILLGLLLGMQHALEADHLAAVASMTAGSRGRRSIIRHGVVWGLGHMATLSVFAGAVLLSRQAVSPALAEGLELAVGVMLVVLGSHALYRLIRERVHIHVHRHGDGQAHIHAHSHAGESRPHRRVPHDHVHPPGFPFRSLLVGMMQGLAGSAALVVLAATALESPLEGLGYVLLFGLGSVLGMALLSAVVSVPLSLTASRLTWLHRGIRGAAGAVSIVLGGIIVL
jgi:ABC-type nickel/cobalt efflux system permease component RcnA